MNNESDKMVNRHNDNDRKNSCRYVVDFFMLLQSYSRVPSSHYGPNRNALWIDASTGHTLSPHMIHRCHDALMVSQCCTFFPARVVTCSKKRKSDDDNDDKITMLILMRMTLLMK